MALLRFCRFLDEEGVRYSVIRHAPAYSAQKAAAAARLPGREVAKVVMVKVDGKLTMAVVPADMSVGLKNLCDATGADTVELASEWEFKDRFADCEAGAMPPFGNLYGIPVYVSAALARDEFIAFHAGNYHQLIRMKYTDYARLVKPRVLDIALQRA